MHPHVPWLPWLVHRSCVSGERLLLCTLRLQSPLAAHLLLRFLLSSFLFDAIVTTDSPCPAERHGQETQHKFDGEYPLAPLPHSPPGRASADCKTDINPGQPDALPHRTTLATPAPSCRLIKAMDSANPENCSPNRFSMSHERSERWPGHKTDLSHAS